MKKVVLYHHGIKGMRWGVRRTPEELGYERFGNDVIIRKNNTLDRKVHYKTGKMPIDEYAEACRLWREYDEINISQKEKEHVYEELDNNLSEAERERCIVDRAIGDYKYTAIQKGHNQYKIINRDLIDRPDNIVDEVLAELFGPNWRNYL